MLRLVSNRNLPASSFTKGGAGSTLSVADQKAIMDSVHQLMDAMGWSEVTELSLAVPQTVWSRSSRRWRQAGWRPQNHRSFPY